MEIISERREEELLRLIKDLAENLPVVCRRELKELSNLAKGQNKFISELHRYPTDTIYAFLTDDWKGVVAPLLSFYELLAYEVASLFRDKTIGLGKCFDRLDIKKLFLDADKEGILKILDHNESDIVLLRKGDTVVYAEYEYFDEVYGDGIFYSPSNLVVYGAIYVQGSLILEINTLSGWVKELLRNSILKEKYVSSSKELLGGLKKEAISEGFVQNERRISTVVNKYNTIIEGLQA